LDEEAHVHDDDDGGFNNASKDAQVAVVGCGRKGEVCIDHHG
jgi:hypothetical protein